jgi:hypothetical protein
MFPLNLIRAFDSVYLFEESIMNAPLFSMESKNTNNAKSEVRLFNASFEEKFK